MPRAKKPTTNCKIAQCPKPARTKGLCPAHYAKEMRAKNGAKSYQSHEPGATCKATGCDRPMKAKGLCSPHYNRNRRGEPIDGVPINERHFAHCQFDGEGGCDKPVHGHGLCAAHYWQQKNGLELRPIRVWARIEGECAVSDCEREVAHTGLCARHYQRKIEGDPEWDRPIKEKAADGEGHLDSDGYITVYVKGRGGIRQHRLFAEQILGRHLLRSEHVHHVDGNRANNTTDGPFVMDERGRLRSGNLEIWSTHQPPGQEIGPKLAWAKEILAHYGDYDEQAS